MRVLALLALLPCVAMAAPECGPKPDPRGSEFYVEFNGPGFAALWYCDGYKPAGFVGHWSELPGDWLYRVPQLLYGTKADRDAAWVAGMTPGNYADVNPLMASLRAKHDKDYQAPPLPTTPKLLVQPTSATVVGDRPVYRLKADGTRNTTAVSGKRAIGNTPCDPSRRIGTTNYYAVPALRDSSGDVYAVCVSAP